MKETKCLQGYVIKLSEYKDSDKIVTILAKDGFYSFHARGVKNVKSKNASSLLLFSYSSFLLEINGKNLLLKEATLLKEPPYSDSLIRMSSLSFISELISRLLVAEGNERIFSYLDKMFSLMREGFSEINLCLFFFAFLLKEIGYSLNVDECVICHSKKDIVGLDIYEGGFVCKREEESSAKCLPSRILKIIRYIFKCEMDNLGSISFESKECLQIIKILSDYLEQILAIKLRSLKPLELAV